MEQLQSLSNKNLQTKLEPLQLLSPFSKPKTQRIRPVTCKANQTKINLDQYDEIEQKDILIKQKINNLKKIKDNTIKDFVYTNKNIPESWKKQLSYQNNVIKLLCNDRNFLFYVGQGGAMEIKKKLDKNSFKIRKRNEKNRENFQFKRSSLTTLKEEPSKENTNFTLSTLNSRNDTKTSKPHIFKTFRFYKNELSNHEINKILEDYKEAYPISKKLEELCPEKCQALNKKIN